jgi:hypothetical protein
VRDGINVVLAVFAAFTIAFGIVNFFVFLVSSQRLGGDALNGYVRDGHYYVTSHGSATEVTKAQWRQSLDQAQHFFIAMPLAMLGMGYILFGYFFPSRTFRGSREALAETEPLVKASGAPLASGRYGGYVGTLSLSTPLLGVAIYPGGVVLKPLLMPSLAIAADDLVAVEFTRFWMRRVCELTHTSVQVARPIRLSCTEQDPVVAALRSLLPPSVS